MAPGGFSQRGKPGPASATACATDMRATSPAIVFVHPEPREWRQATVLDTVELKPEDRTQPWTVAGQGVWRTTPYVQRKGTYSYYFEASDGDSVRQVYQDDANKVPFSGRWWYAGVTPQADASAQVAQT